MSNKKNDKVEERREEIECSLDHIDLYLEDAFCSLIKANQEWTGVISGHEFCRVRYGSSLEDLFLTMLPLMKKALALSVHMRECVLKQYENA